MVTEVHTVAAAEHVLVLFAYMHLGHCLQSTGVVMLGVVVSMRDLVHYSAIVELMSGSREIDMSYVDFSAG